MKNVWKANAFLGALLVAVFGLTSGVQAQQNGGWVEGYDRIHQFGLPTGRILDIAMSVAWWFLAILGAIGVIGFVISGILYLTAAGDDKQMEKAKNAMKWSIIGVIVALSGVVILQAATWMLNASPVF